MIVDYILTPSCLVVGAPVQLFKSGIDKVVAPYSDNSRWKEDFKISKMMFDEADVEICLLENFTPNIQVKE